LPTTRIQGPLLNRPPKRPKSGASASSEKRKFPRFDGLRNREGSFRYKLVLSLW